jgi:hypothetical protein
MPLRNEARDAMVVGVMSICRVATVLAGAGAVTSSLAGGEAAAMNGSISISSKWLTSGRLKSPPQRPPSPFQIWPRKGQKSGVVDAGRSPTRRSTAKAGHRVWRESGALGLT